MPFSKLRRFDSGAYTPVEPPPPVIPWTPSSITTAVWFDPSDASTLTLNGSNVSEMRDKSGNNRHGTQETAANQPALTSAAINGLSALTTNGTSHYLQMTTAGNVARTVSYVGVFAVVRCDNVAAASSSFFFVPAANSAASLVLSGSLSGGSLRQGGRRIWLDSFASANAPASTIANNEVFLYGGENNYNITQARILKNGTQVALNNAFQTAGVTENNDAANFVTIGAQANVTLFWQGAIGELIVLTSEPTTLTRQRIEGYLAHKWGLTAGLDAGHPFKTNPPTL